jgi:iron complex outermembrane receptor protein
MGRLIDEESKPISYSLVSLYQLPNGDLKTQMFPSEEGVFSFQNLDQGTYQVFIEGGFGFEVYQSNSLIIKDTVNPNIDLGTITLKYIVQEANTATVVGERAIPLLEHDIDKTTMNIEGTSLSTLPSLLTVLQLAPGVLVDGNKVSISGKSNVLLLINGKTTSLKLENIPPNIIESVEIISNPSAEYDANVGAVLNIKLKKGSLEGIQGNFYAKYTQGIYPRVDVGSFITFNKGKFSAQLELGYNYDKTRAISIANRAFESAPPVYYSSTSLRGESTGHNFYTNLNLGWDFSPKHNITLSGEYSISRGANTTYQEDAFKSTLETAAIDSSLNNTTNGQSKANNFQVQLSYNGQFGKNWTIASAVNYMQLTPFSNSDYNFEFTNTSNPNNNFGFNYQMDDSTKAGLLIGQVDLSWNKEANRIDFGAKYTNINTYYSILFNNNDVQFTGNNNWFKYDESIYAAYLQWKGGIGKVQWKVGLRGEYATTKGLDKQNIKTDLGQFNYFPSAVCLFIPSKKHIFKLSYKKSIQRVSFFNRSPYSFYTGLYTKFEGNTSLRPEITHSIEFDYILMSRFTFKLYYNEVTDYISQISERNGSLETFKSINFQNSNFGLNISGQLALSNWWKIGFKLIGTGIYTRGEVQDQPFNTWSAYTNLVLMQSFNLWNWMGVDAIANYKSPYSVGIYNTSHLFSFDLNLRKTFFDDQLTVSIYLSDLFGTNLQRNSIDFNTQQMDVLHNRDVRTATLSLIYNFSKGREKEIEPINTINDNTIDRMLKD